jgi:acetyl-CoA synthetase
MGTVIHHVTGTCLTYANDSAVKREDTAWQEGRDVWWQVS